MQCMVCGRFLIGSNVSSGSSKGVKKFVHIDKTRSTNINELICPISHEYSLIDITSTIDIRDINIKIDLNVVESIKAENDFQNFDLKGLILNDKTKMYEASYNVFTRILSDKFKFGRKPNPSNQVLDSVIFYICADTKDIMPDRGEKKIIFAIVGEKLKGANFIYKIVWYYLRGVESV